MKLFTHLLLVSRLKKYGDFYSSSHYRPSRRGDCFCKILLLYFSILHTLARIKFIYKYKISKNTHVKTGERDKKCISL